MPLTEAEKQLPLYCIYVDKSHPDYWAYPRMIIHPAPSEEEAIAYARNRYKPPFPVGKCERICEAGEWLVTGVDE